MATNPKDEKKDAKSAQVQINEIPDESTPGTPSFPASEAQVSHAHEFTDEETARRGVETNQEGQRRRAGDPLGLQLQAERDQGDEGTRLERMSKKAEAEIAEETGHDFTSVTMIVDCEPPHVADFNVRRRLGLTMLKQGETYRVPMNVAAVLVDAKKAILSK